jgi:4-hydroxybenzoate polyprenyltransferase
MIFFREYFHLLKVHHWIKNFTIFLPVIAAHNYSTLNLLELLLHFFNISFLSSTIYLFNNVRDYEDDIKNKILKYEIKINKKSQYYFFGLLFFIAQIAFLILIDSSIWIICVLYLAISISYNQRLKNIKYLDIITIALFHILRLIYGSEAFRIELSLFFILFCSCIFLMIGTNKRVIETKLGYSNRPYNFNELFKLQVLQYLFALLSILIFTLYIFSPDTIYLFKDLRLNLINLLIIIAIVLNFLFNKKLEQDVVIFFYRNKTNYLLSILFFIIYIINSNFF